MLILSMIVGVLTVTRLAVLIADDEITVGFRRWVVKRNGVNGMLTKLVHCAPWCMSMWFSIFIMPIAVLFPNRWVIGALSIPAGSMVAAIILKTMDKKE